MSSDADEIPKRSEPLSRSEPEFHELEREVALAKEESSPTLLSKVAESILRTLNADGVAIALSDSKGLFCCASKGNAPSVGMRLQADSILTRECFETGRALLCLDAERDSRVDPTIARMLRFRSAAVIPIQARRAVLGVVEVFSSRPAAFDTAQITGLTRIAQKLGPIARIERSGAIKASGAPALAPRRELPALLYQMRGARQLQVMMIASSIVALLFLLAFWMYHLRRDSASSKVNNSPSIAEKKVSPAQPIQGESLSHENAPKTLPQQLEEKQSSSNAIPSTSLDESRTTKETNVLPPSISHNAVSAAKVDIPDTTALSSVPLPPVLGSAPAVAPPESEESKRSAPALTTPVISRAMPRPVTEPTPHFVLDRTLSGHSGWITGVAFSADGRLLLSGSWNRGVQLWNLNTGQKLGKLRGPVKRVQALAYSRDGKWVASENSDNSITLWNATTMREVRTWPGKRFLSSYKSTWVYSIAFSPDSQWLASAVDDKTIRLWNVDTGQPGRDLVGSSRSVLYVAFSPDGRLLASGVDDKKVGIWDVATGKIVHVLSGHKGDIDTIAFSPDGRWLASAGEDKSIKLWNLSTGREVRSLTGHGGRVSSLSFSPDGKWLASGSWDKSVKIWDVSSGRELASFPGVHSVYSVSFDLHGKHLASGSEDGKVRLWRLDDSSVRAQSSEKGSNAED